MKTVLNVQFFKSLVILGSILALAGCGPNPSKPDTAKEEENKNQTQSDPAKAAMAAAPAEDVLDISTHTVDPGDACKLVKEGLDHLSVNGNSLPEVIETIDSTSLHSLQRAVKMIRAADPFCGKYVTALRIFLGLNNTDNAMKLLYKPVYMCRAAGSNSVYTLAYESPVYFKYAAGTFTPADAADETCIDNYQEKIKMDRYILQFPRGFRDVPDSTGDTKSLFYTFQELDSVMISNNVDKVKLWNYSFRVKIGITKYTKHSIFLSPPSYVCPIDKKSKPFKILPYKNQFADRSHLCPPSCLELIYKVRNP